MAWLATQRQEFQAIAVRLARHLADSSTGAQRIRHLHRLVALDPLDETAAAMLAHALVEAGRREEAHALVAGTERQLRQAGLPVGPALRLSLRTQQPRRPAPAPAGRGRTQPVVRGSSSGRLSVAVLPFSNHSAELVADDLADAFHEAVVHMLSRFRDLEVAGFAKTLSFRGQIRDPSIVGAELGSSHLVGGSMLARDGVLRLR